MHTRRRSLCRILLLTAASLAAPSARADRARQEHEEGLAREAKSTSALGMALLRMAHLSEPANPRYLYDLVKALLKRKRHGEAIRYGEQLMREHPGTSYATEARGHLVRAYRTLSQAMQESSRWEEALVALEHALALDPSGAQSERLTEELTQGYIHLTGLYVRSGQYEWAIDAFEGLSNLRHRPGFDGERIGAVIEGQGLGKPMPQVFVKAAEARQQRGDVAGAREMLGKMQKLLPGVELPKSGRALEERLLASAAPPPTETGSMEGDPDDHGATDDPGN